MSTKHHAGLFYVGTTAERTALGTSALRAGTLFQDTDTALFYWWDGSSWINTATGGTASAFDLDGVADAGVLDADGDTTISAPVDDQIDFEVAGTDQLHLTDGKLWPTTDNDIDLGDATHEFKNAYFDGITYTDQLDVDEYMALGPNAALSADRLIDTSHQAINTTGQFTGIDLTIKKTAGVTDFADDFIGLRSLAEVDQNGGEIGQTLGIYGTANLIDGTIGSVANPRNMWGLYSNVSLTGGTITGDAFGAQLLAVQGAGNTVSGDMFALSLLVGASGTVTGSTYALYIYELTSLDYGIYHSGSADNYLGGNLGIATTSPLGKLDIAGGADANGDGDLYDILLQYRFGNYRHRIRSRHSGATAANNAIDFFTWNYGVDAVGDVGTKHVMTLDGTGRVGIGVTSPTGMLHIDQSSATGAIPVLKLDQADLSEGFVDYLGTSAASAVGPISTWTTGNSIQGFVRVEINGAAYWMPYYDAPTS